MRLSLQIAALAPADWPDVRDIYLEGLATGQASFQTDAPEWKEWDAGHLQVARLVARMTNAPPEQRRSVVAWAALSPTSARPCYSGVAEVSVYVSGEVRGLGVGSALLAALVSASEAAQIWTLQASIFPENAASVRLHENAGFRLVGRRERIAQHYGTWRDTLLLERRSALVGGVHTPVRVS